MAIRAVMQNQIHEESTNNNKMELVYKQFNECVGRLGLASAAPSLWKMLPLIGPDSFTA